MPCGIKRAVLGRVYEERGNLMLLEPGQSTANLRHHEVKLRAVHGKGQEVGDILLDLFQGQRVDVAVLGGNRKALAHKTNTLGPSGSPLFQCHTSGTGTVDTSLVRSEDEDEVAHRLEGIVQSHRVGDILDHVHGQYCLTESLIFKGIMMVSSVFHRGHTVFPLRMF